MAKNHSVVKNWPKYVLQWGVLLALLAFILGPAIVHTMAKVDPEKYCPVGGLQALMTFFTRGSLPCSMSSVQIVMGIALAVAVILFSKLFCGFLCPVGTVEDLMTKLRKALKMKAVKIQNGSIIDSILRIFKYILLFVVFYFTVTESELFCKNLDPYYAMATGFKGEITLWMAIVTVAMVFVGGLFIDRFWCKYICPLGAISNTFKFWIWSIALLAAYYILAACGIALPVWLMLVLFCIVGYVLEVVVRKPKFQAVNMIRNESLCNGCGLCEKQCPYSIKISEFNGKVNHVDCTLCGECAAACNKSALYVGTKKDSSNASWKKFIAPVATVVITLIALVAGDKFEIPTINETWGIEGYDADSTLVQLVDPATLETLKIENLTSVHCYGSSMAFKAKLEKIKGTHGVKTYVRSHNVIVTYDPKVITPEKLTEEIYEPSHCRIESPDHKEIPEIKVVTIRTDKMFNKSDLNNLANQFRFTYTDKKVYGIDSEYDCPLIVHLYMDPSAELTEDEIKGIVEKKTVDITNAQGEVLRQLPVNFEFVKMEKNEKTIDTREYLEMMFDSFTSGDLNGRYTDANDSTYVEKRAQHFAEQQWYVYEIENQGFEKPIYKRSYPFVSNWLSSEEGVIRVDVKLNSDYKPALQITYTEPMTAEKIWEMLTSETWKITYSVDDVREEPARIKFSVPGTTFPIEH